MTIEMNLGHSEQVSEPIYGLPEEMLNKTEEIGGKLRDHLRIYLLTNPESEVLPSVDKLISTLGEALNTPSPEVPIKDREADIEAALVGARLILNPQFDSQHPPYEPGPPNQEGKYVYLAYRFLELARKKVGTILPSLPLVGRRAKVKLHYLKSQQGSDLFSLYSEE
ncbi:MAG TPA: hypothetical protein VK338_01230 [Candidatus Nitrosocosmicus sp.]|nr:hypothetical protein [Candidatus Nitrosocosmicus sp.]